MVSRLKSVGGFRLVGKRAVGVDAWPTCHFQTALTNRETLAVSQSKTLVMLLAAYAAATWFPAPALYFRSLQPVCWWPDFGFQNLLLAVMLLSAGLSCRPGAVWSMLSRPFRLIGGSAVIWLLPVLAAIAVVKFLDDVAGFPSQVLLALLVIAAMPPANSTVGWAQLLGANLALTLSLVLLAVIAAPVATPLLIRAGMLTTGVPLESNQPVHQLGSSISVFLTLWVLLPMLAGLAIASRQTEATAAKVRLTTGPISLVALVLLNYLNGAVCLPQLTVSAGQLAQPLLASLLLVMLSWMALKWTVGHVVWRNEIDVPSVAAASGHTESAAGKAKQSDDQRSLILAGVMRNTGAALVYTTLTAPSLPLLSLTIIVYTLLQHLMVAVCHTFATDQSESLSPQQVESTTR